MFFNIVLPLISLCILFYTTDFFYIKKIPILQFLIIFNISMVIFSTFYNIYLHCKYGIKKDE